MYLEKEKIVIENGLEVDEAKLKKDKADLEQYESVDDTTNKVVVCVGFTIGIVVGIVAAVYSFVIEDKFSFGANIYIYFLFFTLAGFIISGIPIEAIEAGFYHFKTKGLEDRYTLKKRLEEYALLNQEVNDIATLKKILLNKDTVVLLHDDYRIVEISGLDENGLERKFIVNINNVYYKDTDSFTIIYKMEDNDSTYRDIRCFHVDLELPREYYKRLRRKPQTDKVALV